MPKKDAGAAGITVHLRVRPSKKASNFFESDSLDDGGELLRWQIPSDHPLVAGRDGEYVNNSKLNHRFRFDSIIPMDATQEDVFATVGQAAVANVLDGYNSTVFAYGQTGSGKTFTITGGPERYQDRGIIPRAISAIFAAFRERADAQWTAHVSYLELYNEQGFDLLDPSHDTKALEDLPRVKMLEDEDGNFHLRNLSMHRAESEEDALNLLFLGDTNRAISETAMNQASSRSHCIFTLFVEGRKVGSDRVMRAKLHLVDLAGSERVHKTKSDGQTLREAQFINTSLFFLEMVIVALGEKSQGKGGRTHVPYRNSMMTSVLRDSLGGNCKTIMVATISAEAAQTEESLSTCRFAQRVALVKNDALVNEDVDPAQQIVRLKGEVSNLKAEVAYLKGEAGEGAPVTDDERAALRAACEAYVGSRDPHAALAIGSYTLAKIHDCFAILKNLGYLQEPKSA